MITSRIPKPLVGALIVLALIAVISMSNPAQLQDTVEWIISLQPTQVFVDQPFLFKAYAHDPMYQIIYHVWCRVTITNMTDVILYDTVDGSPAVKEYVLSEVGIYTFRAFCTNEHEPETVYIYSATITVSYPTPTIEYVSAKWNRPLVINVITPYPYTGYPVTVVYSGTEYTSILQDGVASFTLPPITKPENMVIRFLGVDTEYQAYPELPSMNIYTDVDVVKAGAPFTFMVEIADDLGAFTLPVAVTALGDCVLPPPPYFSGVNYTATVKTNAVSDTCMLTAEYEPWSGVKLSAQKAVVILPQLVVRHDFTVTNTSNWDYVFTSYVEFDSPVTGTLTMYINDNPVVEVTGTQSVFTLTHTANLKPGVYTVRAVFVYDRDILILGDITLDVPKYPYTILPPAPVIHAGEDIVVPNADYYVIFRNDTYVVIHAIYPGDNEHASAAGLFTIRIITPEINLTESSISVSKAVPGSTVEVFCRLGASTLKIMELYMTGSSMRAEFPGWINCDYVYAVYTYKNYKQVVFANELEQVKVLTTTCKAGEPCILLAPSNKIVSAMIGTYPYTPGEAVQLPPGAYTLTVLLSDNHKLEYTVYVAEVNVKAYAWYDGAWKLKIVGPPGAKVRIALASGLTIELGVGTHTLFSEPESAYWQYGEVEFVKYRLVK